MGDMTNTIATNADIHEAAEVAATAVKIYYNSLWETYEDATDGEVLLAASNLVAADTIATAILEANQ